MDEDDESAILGQDVVLREKDVLTPLLNGLPQKAQLGFSGLKEKFLSSGDKSLKKIIAAAKTNDSLKVEYTCLDVTMQWIVLGCNFGIVFLYNRKLHKISKFICEHKQIPVVSLKLLEDRRFIATGQFTGAITLFHYGDDKNGIMKVLLKCTVEGHHTAPVTSILWTPDGMKLFTGDSEGNVAITVINMDEGKTHTVFICKEDSPVTQLSFAHTALLVSTLKRTLIWPFNTKKIVQVGSQERKVFGNFGACFLPGAGPEPSDEPVDVYAARPGLRLWKATIDGKVLSTMMFKESINKGEPAIETIDLPSKIQLPAQSEQKQFGSLIVFNEQFVVSWQGSNVWVIDPITGFVIGCHGNLGCVVDVKACSNELFVLSKGEVHFIRKLTYETIVPCIVVEELDLNNPQEIEKAIRSSSVSQFEDMDKLDKLTDEVLSKTKRVFSDVKSKVKGIKEQMRSREVSEDDRTSDTSPRIAYRFRRHDKSEAVFSGEACSTSEVDGTTSDENNCSDSTNKPFESSTELATPDVSGFVASQKVSLKEVDTDITKDAAYSEEESDETLVETVNFEITHKKREKESKFQHLSKEAFPDSIVFEGTSIGTSPQRKKKKKKKTSVAAGTSDRMEEKDTLSSDNSPAKEEVKVENIKDQDSDAVDDETEHSDNTRLAANTNSFKRENSLVMKEISFDDDIEVDFLTNERASVEAPINGRHTEASGVMDISGENSCETDEIQISDLTHKNGATENGNVLLNDIKIVQSDFVNNGDIKLEKNVPHKENSFPHQSNVSTINDTPNDKSAMSLSSTDNTASSGYAVGVPHQELSDPTTHNKESAELKTVVVPKPEVSSPYSETATYNENLPGHSTCYKDHIELFQADVKLIKTDKTDIDETKTRLEIHNNTSARTSQLKYDNSADESPVIDKLQIDSPMYNDTQENNLLLNFDEARMNARNSENTNNHKDIICDDEDSQFYYLLDEKAHKTCILKNETLNIATLPKKQIDRKEGPDVLLQNNIDRPEHSRSDEVAKDLSTIEVSDESPKISDESAGNTRSVQEPPFQSSDNLQNSQTNSSQIVDEDMKKDTSNSSHKEEQKSQSLTPGIDKKVKDLEDMNVVHVKISHQRQGSNASVQSLGLSERCKEVKGEALERTHRRQASGHQLLGADDTLEANIQQYNDDEISINVDLDDELEEGKLYPVSPFPAPQVQCIYSQRSISLSEFSLSNFDEKTEEEKRYEAAIGEYDSIDVQNDLIESMESMTDVEDNLSYSPPLELSGSEAIKTPGTFHRRKRRSKKRSSFPTSPCSSDMEGRPLHSPKDISETIQDRLRYLADSWADVNLPTCGQIQSIACSDSVVWVVDNHGHIFCSGTSSQVYNWKKQDGRAMLVACNQRGTVVWCVDRSKVCYYRTGIKDNVPHGTGWEAIEKNVHCVAVDEDCVWLIKTNGDIFVRTGVSYENPAGFDWITVKTASDLVQVTCLNGLVWALDIYNHVQIFQGDLNSLPYTSDEFDQTAQWCELPGLTATHVLLGAQGVCWVIDREQGVWFNQDISKENQLGGTWYQLSLGEHQSQDGGWFSSVLSYFTQGNEPKMIVSNETAGVFILGKQGFVHIAHGHLLGTRWEKLIPSKVSDAACWTCVSAAGSDMNKGCIWALQPNGQLFCFKPGGQCYSVQPPNRVVLKYCSAGPRTLWALTAGQDVYVRLGISDSCPQGLKWLKVDMLAQGNKRLMNICCGNRVVWAVDFEGNAWFQIGREEKARGAGFSPAWVSVEGCPLDGSQFKKIAVGPDDHIVWACDDKNNMYARKDISDNFWVGTSWEVVSGTSGKDISISNNHVWGLCPNGDVMCRFGVSSSNVIGDYWKKVPGCFDQISVSPKDELCGIDRHGLLYERQTLLFYGSTLTHKAPSYNDLFSDHNDWEFI